MSSNEEIFDYISRVKGVSEKTLRGMVARRFKKTHQEAKELIWAYLLG